MIFNAHRLSAEELAAVLADPEKVGALFQGDPDDLDLDLDLDKAWHGLHYLLTGDTYEIRGDAGPAVLGGEPIGPDLGMGPARLLMPDAVRAVAAGLDAVDEATLLARFDPAAMSEAEIYPHIWDDGGDEFDGYLLPNFTALRDFYRAAAEHGDGVLLAVT
ncbi:YfbM family protein [Micromonospora chalcea]|uniref:YfbM family protein n=1 Tax=Micromonospora chalcea TaxID=1874 RepID=UPI0021A410D2|nr:YfbM family protein [Micromonospora chalcea]MCT2282605.1 YfbM family protein [Micromonospora chalcea]